jgi:hypothetical protein
MAKNPLFIYIKSSIKGELFTDYAGVTLKYLNKILHLSLLRYNPIAQAAMTMGWISNKKKTLK